MNTLKNIQQWVQGVITHPEGVHKGAFETVIENQKWSIDSIVSPSNKLTSQQRITIYHNAYFARLIECFNSEYSGLLNALGEELFNHLTGHFLQAHPSSTYTLNELGKRFPSYLETMLNENLQGNTPDWWQLFIIDMAKYERLFTEVYNGEGHERLGSDDDIFGLNPIKPSPSLVTLQLQFPISTCIGLFRDSNQDEFPEPSQSNYIFSRDNYRVKVHLVNDEEWNAIQHWISNPSEDAPSAYHDSWLMKGIGYS